MPFSNTVKYCILGISVTLLLLCAGDLGMAGLQMLHTAHTTYARQDTVNSELLYSEEKSQTAGNFSRAPSTRVEEVSTEVCRRSRCLSQASFPSQDPARRREYGRAVHMKNVVNGSLRFSIYYDQLQSQLVVTILQVEGF
ncbi:hypothetical protein FQN60_014461 [Etheostoma spectabile]|uniref:Uncharacterized protein n=1 Tax=Etheostoma spectabile TaxID=54343 RepID=A0A5J5D8V6_9PERO|nr:hypothetical protein FQN60_014461 [Etheostoma spectabile]